jgi:hypothetical protein
MKSDLTPETIKKYIESLKILENSQKKGFNKGKWYPYDSLEGGNDTTAYGHKITGKEGIDFYKGITEPQATQLLEKDIIEHQKLAKEYIDAIYGKGIFDSLSQDRQMLLTDYVFNGVQLSGFPLFTKGTLENNKETMLNEYKRYYKDKNGVTKPLIERNNWTKNVIENMLDNSNNESSKYTSPYNISPNYNYSLPLDNLRVNKQNQYLFKSGGVLRDPTKPYHPINNPDGYGKPIIVNPNDPAGRQRYQSYQDSLVTYNNAQLYNRDLRNLIDQNLADGASRTHDQYYTTGMFSSYGYSSKNDAEKAKNKFNNDQAALARKYRLNNNLNPYNHTVDFFNDWFLYYHHPPSASPSGQGYLNAVRLNPQEAAFPKPQEVIYDTTPPDPPQPEPQPPTREKINISPIPVKYNTTYSPPPLDPSKFKRPAIKPTSSNKNLYIQFKDPNQSTNTSQEIINFDDWDTYKEFNDALQNAGRMFGSYSMNMAKTKASASYGGLTKEKAMEIYKKYNEPKSTYRTGGLFKDPPVNPYAQGQNPLMPQTLVSTNPTIKILPTTQELQKNQLDKVIQKDNSNRPVIKQNKKPDPTSFNEDNLKVIQLGLDVGQMIPLTSFPSYIASLPFTTNDVVNDLSKKEYKQAGLDALGYIPTFKAFKYGLKGDKVLDTSSKLAKQYRKINHVVNIANFSNDANQIKKQNGGWLNNYADGGLFKKKNNNSITPNPLYKSNKDYVYNAWRKSLPENLRNESEGYNLRGAWEGGLEPEYVTDDMAFHLSSRNPNTGEILKSPGHDTYNMAIEGDIRMGYTPRVDLRTGKIYTTNSNDPVLEGPFKNVFAKGGKMIKRANGSYSQRGLWDNIRANKGSGKKPTRAMLEQERKIKNK